MAEKKVIEIEVKTQDAVKSMDALSKSTKEAGKEFDKAATFAERYGEELQPLTTRMGEAEDRLYELANAGQTTTKEYKELLKTVGDFRKVQISTDMAVDASASTLGQKLGGALGGVTAGFSLAQGAFAVFGSESKEVEQALLKVQAAMAIQQGVQGIRESINSFKALGAAIKATSVYQGTYNFIQTGSIKGLKEETVAKVADTEATVAQGVATENLAVVTTGSGVASLFSAGAAKILRTALVSVGIGVFMVALGALIDNFDYLMNLFTGSADVNLKQESAIKKNTKALELQVKANEKASTALKTKNGHEYKMAEASGASATALHKLAIRHANEEIALERASKATAHNTYIKERNTLAYYRSIDASDEVIKKQVELTTAARENSVKEGKDLAAALENKAQLIRDNDVRIASEKHSRSQSNHDKTVKTDKVHQDKTVKNQKVQAKEEIDISKQIEDEKLRLQDESLAKELAALKLKYERKKEEEDKQLKAKTLKQKDYDTLQTQATESFRYDKSQIVEKYLNQESQLETVSSRNAIQGLVDGSKTRLEIEKTTSEKSIQISKEEKEKKAEILQQQLDLVKESFQAFADVATLFAGKNKKAQKTAFNIQKGANIAATTIDTYTAAMAAYKSALAVPVIGVGLAPIAAAGAVAVGLMNIKKIAASQFEGGGTPSADTGGGGGATAPTMSAPQFNVVGQSGVNQLASLNQQPIQAYVVSGQVTSQQALDRNRLANATLGG